MAAHLCFGTQPGGMRGPPAETIKEGESMDFKYNEVLDLWVAETDFLGMKIKVRLYCSDDDNFAALAGKVLRDVRSKWESLKAAMVAELYPQYREQGNREISADEFFSHLNLKAIDFDTIDIMYTLFCSDSGMFGGHSIQVLWDPDADFHADVSLVG
jgi:hypothetical protein